jgi:hypothetical protein
MLKPMPLYEYTRLDRILEAAATEIRRLCRSSWRRHCMPRYASQYWQSYKCQHLIPTLIIHMYVQQRHQP